MPRVSCEANSEAMPAKMILRATSFILPPFFLSQKPATGIYYILFLLTCYFTFPSHLNYR